MSGKLTIVPTPIGNLGDMTTRAVEALRAADFICVEDTRVTGKLLCALGIEGKHLERFDEHVLLKKIPSLRARLAEGAQVAYCSDAGMPGVSDPGLRLIAALRKSQSDDQSFDIEILPGPSAAVTAYVASGTSAESYYFGGFFPRKDKERLDTLTALKDLPAALIFYESPKRLSGALNAIAQSYPQRQITVCRELTKLHEEIVWGLASQVAQDFAQRDAIKGEIVIVIDPPATCEGELDPSIIEARACELAGAEGTPGVPCTAKSLAQKLVDEFKISRNEAYEHALKALHS